MEDATGMEHGTEEGAGGDTTDTEKGLEGIPQTEKGLDGMPQTEKSLERVPQAEKDLEGGALTEGPGEDPTDKSPEGVPQTRR